MDKTSAERLFAKLKQQGVFEPLISLIASRLRQRRGAGLVKGVASQEMPLEDRVFKGTVIRLVRWHCSFDDLAEAIDCAGSQDISNAEDWNAFQEFKQHVPDEDVEATI